MSHRIVIDSREQRPYAFDTPAITHVLPAGDYSLEGLESLIAIERKSLDDWIGTILNSRARFHREILKLREYVYAAIVIEASFTDITAHRYKSAVKPDALIGIITDLMIRWAPVQIVMAGDRPHGRMVTEKLLRFAERYVERVESDIKRIEEEDANSCTRIGTDEPAELGSVLTVATR